MKYIQSFKIQIQICDKTNPSQENLHHKEFQENNTLCILHYELHQGNFSAW
jgi:hypothetical protein